MIFEFEKLGAIASGSLELKDLTVICGKNNLGKTYLAYAIFGFLENVENLFEIDIPEQKLRNLRSEGQTTIDLKELIFPSHEQSFDMATQKYLTMLPKVLAANEKLFLETKLKVRSQISEEIFVEGFSSTLGSEEKKIVSFTRKPGESVLNIVMLNETDEKTYPIPDSIIKIAAVRSAWDSVFPEPFILSTERTGAITFKNELNISRNKLLKMLHNAKEEEITPSSILSNFFATDYAAPIHKNVEATNRMASEMNQRSELVRAIPEIEAHLENITGGKFGIRSSEVNFSPKRGVQLKMSESSSSVRSMALLSHYILHLAKKNDLLIIDEPELNLHPENQRRFARFIAKLVNFGIKVFITTHSDYVVRELNTLLLLSNENDEMRKIQVEFGYDNDEILTEEKFGLYSIVGIGSSKNSKITRIKLDQKKGIETSAFDEVINEMNRIQEEIFFALN